MNKDKLYKRTRKYLKTFKTSMNRYIARPTRQQTYQTIKIMLKIQKT